MTVELRDKRRSGQRIPGLGMSNGTWFAVLDIPVWKNLLTSNIPMTRSMLPQPKRKDGGHRRNVDTT